MSLLMMARRTGNGPIQHCPRLTCDRCDKVIEDAWHAWYMWDMNDLERKNPAPHGTPLYILCKPHCTDAWEKEHPDKNWGSMEVTYLPVYLVNNLGIDWDQACDAVAGIG